MEQRTEPGSAAVPGWLTQVFGPAADEAAPLGWGFSNETWAGRLPDGRRVAATRLADPAFAATLAARFALIRPSLAEAGLPIPLLVETQPPPPHGVLLTEFVDGASGAEILDHPGGPALVGMLLGAAWRRLGGVRTTDLGLPALWASAGDLAAAARRWSNQVVPDLGAAHRGLLEIELADLPSLIRDRPFSVVHGDLVPVNILIDHGRLAALLDLQAVRLADPLLDAAWFDWIVWFHHPAEEPAAWTAFAAEAGLDRRDAVTGRLMRSYPIVRLLEILDGVGPGSPARPRWLAQLSACLERARD